MFRTKKSQAILVGAMLGLLAFLTVVQFITPIKDAIIDARDTNSLDCGNSSISTGVKATCVIVDWTLPGFVGMVVFTAIGIAGGAIFKKTKAKSQ